MVERNSITSFGMWTFGLSLIGFVSLFHIPQGTREVVIRQANSTCQGCGKHIPGKETLHHKSLLQSLGKRSGLPSETYHDPNNLAVYCRSCHDKEDQKILTDPESGYWDLAMHYYDLGDLDKYAEMVFQAKEAARQSAFIKGGIKK